jgi:leader peptidase (prepilin peptidase)/N-methyltransferase
MKATVALCAVAGSALLVVVGQGLGFDGLALARLVVLGAALGALVPYDLAEHRIPNRIVLPSAALCGALSITDGVRAGHLILGAVLLALLLAVSLARPALLGMGDVKLALLMLCALHAATPRALGLAIELYALIALVIVLRRGRAAFAVSLPLAPFMAAGSLLALLI